MPVKIEFSTANAAFAEGGFVEVANMLEKVAKTIADKPADAAHGGPIQDSNGNTIGLWFATIDAEEPE